MVKVKKSERLQLRLTEETLRRLHVICSFYDCRMSDWFQNKVDNEYCSKVNLFDSEVINNETA